MISADAQHSPMPLLLGEAGSVEGDGLDLAMLLHEAGTCPWPNRDDLNPRRGICKKIGMWSLIHTVPAWISAGHD